MRGPRQAAPTRQGGGVGAGREGSGAERAGAGWGEGARGAAPAATRAPRRGAARVWAGARRPPRLRRPEQVSGGRALGPRPSPRECLLLPTLPGAWPRRGPPWFGVLQPAAGLFSSPVSVSPSSFTLLHPAQDQARGTSRAAAGNSRPARPRTPGAEPRAQPAPREARSPRSPRPRVLPPQPSPLFPLLQSHGILRMPVRWR